MYSPTRLQVAEDGQVADHAQQALGRNAQLSQCYIVANQLRFAPKEMLIVGQHVELGQQNGAQLSQGHVGRHLKRFAVPRAVSQSAPVDGDRARRLRPPGRCSSLTSTGSTVSAICTRCSFALATPRCCTTWLKSLVFLIVRARAIAGARAVVSCAKGFPMALLLIAFR